MKYLVTGSAGRIGDLACRQLVDDGHEVRGFDLHASGFEHEAYSEVLGPLHDPAAAGTACEGIDSVIHLGAFMSWKPEEVGQMFRSNVEGTRIVLDAAQAAGSKRFVFASSGEVYPENAPRYLPLDEDHPRLPNSPYGATKLLGEELVRFYARTKPMETVILRFSHTQRASEIIDRDSFFSGPRFFLRRKIEQQDAFGNRAAADIFRAADPGPEALVLCCNEDGCAFQMDITDARDMVTGILLAANHPAAANRIYNLGCNDPVDFEAFLPKLSDKLGLPVVRVNLPGPGVLYHTSNARIRSELGFEPEWTIDRMLEDATSGS